MSEVISTRLKKEEVQELNKICKKEKVDRSSLIRKFLLQQIIEYRMKEVGETYRKGLASLAEAATLANVSIYEMMDYVEREKISPPPPTDEDLRKQLEQTKELLEKSD